MIEPPCTERYARWCERSATQLRLLASVCAVSLLVLLEIGIIVPTPTALSGDGYAITQEISLILATYLAPVVIGIVLGCVTKSLYAFIKSKRRKT